MFYSGTIDSNIHRAAKAKADAADEQSQMAFPQTVPQQIHSIIHIMYTKVIYANIVF